ncbi:MAG: efflux RND transporter periplasmic adaptor subunit [Cyanobacteria bacterium P01_D01_bin.44]
MQPSQPPPPVIEKPQQPESQLTQDRKRWPWFLLIFATLLSGGLLWRFFPRSTSSTEDNQPPGALVQLHTVEMGAIENSSEFVGALEAEQRVLLKPEVEGQIVEIYVDSGDSVTPGMPILQLDPDRSQAEVSGAIANVNAARAARNSTEADLLTFEAEQVSAAAEVDLQNTEFERTSALVAQGALSQQELDRVQRDRDAAVAALDAANKRVQAAQANLEEAGAAFSRAQADANVVNEDLDEYRVVAPVEGTIGDIPVKVGDFVAIGDTLTTLTQNQALELRLAIPIEQAVNLTIGLPVELSIPQQDRPVATGQISFISPRVDSSAQAVLAKARFPNPDGLLRDEQFVRARVIWESNPGVLIPTTAISYIGGQTFVYLAQPAEGDSGEGNGAGGSQQVAKQQPVQLGEIQGNSYQVIEGLSSGDAVVTSGLLNLSDGMPISSAPQDSL